MSRRDETIKYYNDNAASFVSGTIGADMSDLYAHFEPYLSPGAKLLDLGCGSGRDSKYFIDRGYEVIPLDGSEELCRLVSEYVGVEAICMDFAQIDFQQEFDAIWACASLLHASAEELPAIIAKLRDALKDGGILYASFKYGAGERTKGQRFFYDSNEADIEALLNEETGFEILELFTTSDVREGREEENWINVIGRKR